MLLDRIDEEDRRERGFDACKGVHKNNLRTTSTVSESLNHLRCQDPSSSNPGKEIAGAR